MNSDRPQAQRAASDDANMDAANTGRGREAVVARRTMDRLFDGNAQGRSPT